MRVLTLLIPFVMWVGVAKAQLPDFRDLVKDVSLGGQHLYHQCDARNRQRSSSGPDA